MDPAGRFLLENSYKFVPYSLQFVLRRVGMGRIDEPDLNLDFTGDLSALFAARRQRNPFRLLSVGT